MASVVSPKIQGIDPLSQRFDSTFQPTEFREHTLASLETIKRPTDTAPKNSRNDVSHIEEESKVATNNFKVNDDESYFKKPELLSRHNQTEITSQFDKESSNLNQEYLSKQSDMISLTDKSQANSQVV